jgi:hypothetical protein
VSYNRRVPRHQGVRYGPPRQRERAGENGAVIGRLLGLGILLLTLGVLAAAAVAFVGDRRAPATTARDSSSVASSPSPTMSASTPASTAIPSVTATVALPTATIALPTVAVTALPTGAPVVQVGAGFVSFGTRSDRQLRIVDPRASFNLAERVTWSGYLVEPANSVDLRVQIYKVDGTPPNGERLISDEAVTPFVTGAQLFQRRIRPADAMDGPGVYVVRYVRGSQIMSQGWLEITP